MCCGIKVDLTIFAQAVLHIFFQFHAIQSVDTISVELAVPACFTHWATIPFPTSADNRQ